MARVTINSIAVENFGPFLDRQTINFEVMPGKPVILIKALNGSGKTTLLNSLQVGLYGQKAINSTRRTEYEQLILGLHRADAKGKAAVEVGLSIDSAIAKQRMVVRREWTRKAEGFTEEVSVYTDNAKDLDLSLNWEEFIEAVLPAELVQLFFFDGEKIEALANPERLPDLLRRATEVFLGIGGIEALSNDLKAVERRAALKNRGNSSEFDVARSHIEGLEVQVFDLDAKYSDLRQQHASAQNAVDQAQVELDKYSAQAQRRGLAAYEQAARIKDSVVESRRRVLENRAGLAEIMSYPVLPTAWLGALWQRYESLWEQDQHARHAALLTKEFKKRDLRVLATISQSATASSLRDLRRTLADDLSTQVTSIAQSAVGLANAPPLESTRQREEARGRLKEQLRLIEKTRAHAERAEREIGQIPAEEQMSEILAGLQERARTLSTAEARMAELTKLATETQSHADHLRARMNAAQERLSSDFRDKSLESKSLEASMRAREALVIFKTRLLASKAEWLSDMITTEFRKLMRKKNLVARVLVEPTTYQVSIEDGKGRELPMERLSAGERQLLAISVLSALIKERKGRFPVVVDTPLARLDQQHRASLINRFFATVSHQVVVLSTDQEVEGAAHDAIRPFTSAEYSLDFDDTMRRTLVTSHAVETELQKEAA